MPHILIKGPVAIEDIWLAFQPMEFVEDGSRMKAEEAYLSHDKNELLVRSTVVEREIPKNFFVKFIAKDDDRIMVCLESIVYAERTEPVKRLLGIYVWKIMQAEPQVEVIKTNIEHYIRAQASA